MLITHLILALLAVALVAARPRSTAAAAVLLGLAACDLLIGGSTGPAFGLVMPLVLFLSAALSLAAMVEQSGLAQRAAAALSRTARGNGFALYACACVLCAVLTAAVSLDGAVVLMVPVLLVLADRWGAPLRPLFLGVLVVANAASIAIPQGNPTNLVVIQRLGLSPAAFAARMFLPGLAAAAVAAVAVAVIERRRLSAGYRPGSVIKAPPSAGERRAAIALGCAALAAWIAPFLGVAPWWPFIGVVAIALVGERQRVTVPWRIAAQLVALLIVIGSLGFSTPAVPMGLPGLMLVAVGISAAAAIVNNLPASVWAGALLAGPAGYAASIGLGIGPLATRHGSVATLIASDLAGDAGPAFPTARFMCIASVAVVTATLLLWAGL